MKTLTIEEKVNEIIEKYDLEKTETTTGMNGYPEWTDVAFYADNLSTMQDAIEEIKELGIAVDELWMKRRDGQHFWNRYQTSFSACDLKVPGDQDYYVVIDSDADEDEQKQQIFEDLFSHLFEDPEEVTFGLIESVEDQVRSLYLDVPADQGEVYAFYDGVNGHNGSFDYCITDETTGYHDDDVTSYQMAFSVDIPNDEE